MSSSIVFSVGMHCPMINVTVMSGDEAGREPRKRGPPHSSAAGTPALICMGRAMPRTRGHLLRQKWAMKKSF